MSKPKADSSYLQWDFIATLANNDLSKFVAAVPVVGYLILFNDGVADVLTFNTIAGTSSEGISPFFLGGMVRLRMVFFGSLFVLCSNILFRICGPKVLIHSLSSLEFSERVAITYSTAELISMEEEILSDKWVPRTPLVDAETKKRKDLRPDRNAKLDKFREKQKMMREHPDYVRAIAREWWAGQMHSNSFARWTTLSVTVAGYLMLLIPTADICQAVVLDLISML